MDQPGRPARSSSPLAIAARDLVRGARRGILSTLIPEDGYPYGSLVELAPLGDGDVIMLLSRLAEHQHYLSADSRASIVIAPGILDEDPLARPRVTLVGTASAVLDRERYGGVYVAAHPSAARYFDFGDFQFYCLHVARVRYIAGFGQMGWIKGDAYRDAFNQ